MSTETMHLESIGHLCQSLQSPYARIQRAIEKLNVRPAVTINGIAHFNEEQTERIADAVRGTGTNRKGQR
jgi:hypothetical protein